MEKIQDSARRKLLFVAQIWGQGFLWWSDRDTAANRWKVVERRLPDLIFVEAANEQVLSVEGGEDAVSWDYPRWSNFVQVAR